MYERSCTALSDCKENSSLHQFAHYSNHYTVHVSVDFYLWIPHDNSVCTHHFKDSKCCSSLHHSGDRGQGLGYRSWEGRQGWGWDTGVGRGDRVGVGIQELGGETGVESWGGAMHLLPCLWWLDLTHISKVCRPVGSRHQSASALTAPPSTARMRILQTKDMAHVKNPRQLVCCFLFFSKCCRFLLYNGALFVSMAVLHCFDHHKKLVLQLKPNLLIFMVHPYM